MLLIKRFSILLAWHLWSKLSASCRPTICGLKLFGSTRHALAVNAFAFAVASATIHSMRATAFSPLVAVASSPLHCFAIRVFLHITARLRMLSTAAGNAISCFQRRELRPQILAKIGGESCPQCWHGLQG